MPRPTLALLAGLALGLGLMAPTAAQADRDCEDFPTQAAAQAALRADPSDPADNDADDDGVACELFDFDDGATDTNSITARSGGAAVSGTPRVTRMPSTGAGPTATGIAAGEGAAPLALLALAAAGGLAWRRLRSA